MKFLHTSWCKNALYVWAEQSVNQADLLCEDADIITYSPFNVEAKALQELLRTILWIDHEELEIQQIEINLPTIYSEKHSFPLPSQYFLIKEQRINEFKISFDQEPRLKLWKIDALRLTARQMVTLLSLCNKKSVMPGVFAGNDILAVKHLFRFSGALITRGCYLPSVVLVSENKYHALWLPVLAPVDIKRFNKIAEQIPEIVFPLTDRQQALELLLNSITDSIVRLSVITTLSRAQALKGKFYSVHDAWLSALRGESAEIRWNEPVELQQLCRTLDEWRYPVDYARHSILCCDWSCKNRLINSVGSGFYN